MKNQRYQIRRATKGGKDIAVLIETDIDSPEILITQLLEGIRTIPGTFCDIYDTKKKKTLYSTPINNSFYE